MLHNGVPNIPRTHWYSSRDLYANQDSILLVSADHVNIYAFLKFGFLLKPLWKDLADNNLRLAYLALEPH